MPVMVIWQRGNKKANSKKRLIKEDSPTAEFEEKFQINTQMDVDANGKPNKPKMSTLTVASDKTRGILGKAELDLSQYGEDSFNEMKLPLVDCQYANSFIIVGLKGIDQAVKTPSKPLQNAGGADGLNESMVNLM